jgi:hypothetical protein
MNLRTMPPFLVGTERHTFRQAFAVQVSGNTDLWRVFNLFLKAQKGTSKVTAAQPPREPEARNSRMTSL